MHNDVPHSNNPDLRHDSRAQAGGPTNYYAFHDPHSAAKISTTVVHALADVMEDDVTNTSFTLYDSVDPDALDRIFSTRPDTAPRPPGHVAFSVHGYRVTVYSSGQIVITPPRSTR